MLPNHFDRLPLALAAAVLFSASSAPAAELAYVTASSQLQETSAPQRYRPMNLLDHNPETLWCAGSVNGGQGQTVRLVFKDVQQVDHVQVTAAAHAGRRVVQLRLSDGSRSVRLPVGSDAIVSLNTPLAGREFTLTIDQVGALGEVSDAGDAACLAEVTFLHGDQVLVNPPHSDAAPAAGSQLQGSWGSAPLGASENQLTFNQDGTWRWVHEPLLGGTQKVQTGTYRLSGTHLQMRLGRTGAWIGMHLVRGHVVIDADELGAPRGDYDTLSLSDGLGTELAGTYNNARF